MILGKQQKIISWVLQLIVAVIFIQSLFFKFTAAEGSIFIFSTLGMEPWGRVGTGIVELIAAILLLIPATVIYGALIVFAVIVGALFSHITILGIVAELSPRIF